LIIVENTTDSRFALSYWISWAEIYL